MNKTRLTAILSAAATALSMTGMTGYAADTASEKTVDQMLSEMTTKQKVEQMIAITLRPWTGGEKQDNLTSLNPELTKLIREHNFSGVTLFAPNIESAEQCAELTDQIQQAALSSECGIKNDDDILPLELGENGKIAYFYPYANVENTMVFTLDRLKKEGIIAEGVTSENVCFRGHNASEYEDNIKNSDVVILALEMYSVPNLDPEDKTRGWQGKFAEEVIELSHKNGKKVIYLSANIPYDIARFHGVDAIVAVYNASGMSEIPVYDHETLG
ncbi:MAG: hypothetical protein IKW87_08380 [Ruminococcus sp.]|nr:hypothetical protein [Ruminococcus sp.]